MSNIRDKLKRKLSMHDKNGKPATSCPALALLFLVRQY